MRSFEILLKEQFKQQKLIEEKFQQFQIVATSVFSSKTSKEFLKMLEDLFIKKPVYEGSESMAAFREGQNDLVRKLIEWSTPSQTLEK
ncbi:hypothetical protein LCGC14_0995130 [marine sediment metagenome]|uniref:Uncharacterized protein n=1 Tax=marine sediment metagenome TaxID=412755 RepID=A0A0F9QN52_9ZZZZ